MPRARVSRRRFLQASATTAAVASLPASSYARLFNANDMLRVASIGCGGKGWSDLNAVAASPKVRVVALCDIDSSAKHLGQAAEKYPHAAKYSDWRKVLDQAGDIDAVIVSTPDHTHAPASLAAMQLGKHVYCQKPLTHTVFEARQMALRAARHNLVTQMGNQINSHEAYRSAVRWVHDGVIGKVREVHSWQSGNMRWLLANDRPEGSDPIPETVNWDLWLGVAAERPYLKTIYHPFNWRGFQAFGTGQLGDFGCHIMDPVFMALELTAPLTIRADAPSMNSEVWNNRSTVRYVFPGTKRTAGETVALTWYDGDMHMPTPEALGLASTVVLPKAGSALLGEKGTMIIPHVALPKLYPEEKFAENMPEKIAAVDHYVGWADACRGEGTTTSNFAYAGRLTETVLLGTIAVRQPGVELRWNAAEMKLSGSPAASALLQKPYRKGWEPTWLA